MQTLFIYKHDVCASAVQRLQRAAASKHAFGRGGRGGLGDRPSGGQIPGRSAQDEGRALRFAAVLQLPARFAIRPPLAAARESNSCRFLCVFDGCAARRGLPFPRGNNSCVFSFSASFLFASNAHAP